MGETGEERSGARAVACIAAIFLALSAASLSPASAQDTTQAYPWRLSYFPYVVGSPNDGLMPLGRVVWFQASRWDARTSVDREVAIEGGYSTRDAWLLRIQGNFPRLAPGWRLQAIAEASRSAEYIVGSPIASSATREIVGSDLTRVMGAHWRLALRAEAMHVNIPIQAGPNAGTAVTETDLRGRLALIYDHRDREYDTRRGYLFQGGALAGSAGTGYAGVYMREEIWVPLGERTRLAGQAGFRQFEETTIDAARIVPAWENEFVAGGGPESNRALPIGAGASRGVEFESLELRHDLFVFTGGAVAILAFGDWTRVLGGDPPVPLPKYDGVSSTNAPVGTTLGLGGGVALRLLRNAVLTATVAVAHGDARVYVSSGWSW
ncbi:MAG: hypothetical protein ACREK8_00200 [Gemmatimonadales bacterium]